MHVLSAWVNGPPRQPQRVSERWCSDSEEFTRSRVRESVLAKSSVEVFDIAFFHIGTRTLMSLGGNSATLWVTICSFILVAQHIHARDLCGSEKVLRKQV